MELESDLITEVEYSMELSEITKLAESRDVASISKMLELDENDVSLSLICVGEKLRKGSSDENKDGARYSHFTHMVRVAYMVKHFFPDDIRSRRLAMLHDIKEEAIPGQEETYLSSDLATDIDLLTEESALPNDIDNFAKILPAGFNPSYFTKYKQYILTLHANWDRLGRLELCDRLDASTSFAYLLHPKYAERLKYKVLESFGRIWATLDSDVTPVSELTRNNCRRWFVKFGVTEQEVVDTARYFL